MNTNDNGSYFNEYHKAESEKAMKEVEEMKKNPLTYEQIKAQFESIDKLAKEQFAEEAPNAQETVKLYKTPLKPRQLRQIYTWLFRNQITLDIIPLDVLAVFKETRQYEIIIRKMKDEENMKIS